MSALTTRRQDGGVSVIVLIAIMYILTTCRQDGGVSAIMFHTNPILTALNPRRAKGGKNVILFSEILARNVESLEGYYIPRIHRDCVKQVGAATRVIQLRHVNGWLKNNVLKFGARK